MKISLKIAAGALALGMLVPSLAFAEDGLRLNDETKAEVKVKAEVRIKASTTKEIRTKAELEALKAKSSTTKDTIRSKVEEKKGEVREKLDEKREQVQNNIRERLANFMEKVKERYQAAIERLDKIVLRIESRIAKVESQGSDQTKAKELLVIAKSKIEIAKASTAAIELEASTTLSADLKAGFPALKESMEKAKEDIKEAHAALVDVIENMKPGLNKDKNRSNATTTATTTDDVGDDD